MRKSTASLLSRLAAITLGFTVAVSVTFVWRIVPSLRPLDSSMSLSGVLTPAGSEPSPWSAEVEDATINWIFRRGQLATEFDAARPVALPTPDANLISAGCATLVVTLDETRKLRLNTEDMGALDDPSKLKARLTEIFYEREINLAYRPGMEERSEIPTRERILKTIVIVPAASLKYGEVLRLVRVVEQTGAAPIVLHTGDATEFFRPSERTYL
ncbi:MAG TPA: hypothetical protein VF656_18220 [Pyrinomonadaceae bacterium]|jgi:hypothetical protein